MSVFLPIIFHTTFQQTEYFARMFNAAPLSLLENGWIFLLASIPVGIHEVIKLIQVKQRNWFGISN